MKYCVKCGLPESYQGITFDSSQVCNFCNFYESHKKELTDGPSLKRLFEREVEAARKKARDAGSKYDCITGLSGGKDGAYITYQLKHTYGMRVLTYTLDNGFSTEFGRENVQILTENLGVDHVWISVDDAQLRQFYTASMKVMKNFCSVCFHFCHYHSHLLAGQHKVPLIVNGRTRSQVLQSAAHTKGIEPFEISRNLQDFEYQMFGKLLHQLEKYPCIDFLPEVRATSLYYFMYHRVGEQEKMDFLEKNVGWKRPKTQIPHPDCWAHPMAEYCSLQKHGYPVRTGELAALVRDGEICLQDALHERGKDLRRYQEIDSEIEKRFYDRIR